MEIKIYENQAEWDWWLKQNCGHTPFAQSWAWGEILKADGKTVERLAVTEKEKMIAQAQVVVMSAFGCRYAFCPQGPVPAAADGGSENYLKFFGDYFKKKNCVFLRIEPPFALAGGGYAFKKTIDINPRATVILDLEKSEEEILAGMHSKTRYNIHLAEKKNLVISDKKELNQFLFLMKQTAVRDSFKLHEEAHYKNVLAAENVYQLTVYAGNAIGGQPIATAVFIGFGDTFTYLYGASDYENRALMAPYLLQWQGIILGKRLGYKFYDFFGVAPQDEPHHQYTGVTRFKVGFGGKYQETLGTRDLIFSQNKYNIYRLLRWFRRKI